MEFYYLSTLLLLLICVLKNALTTESVKINTSRFNSKKFREIENENQNNSSSIGFSRNPKFFPLFTLVRFSNEACMTTGEESGICYTRKQCLTAGGIASGTCASGLGVCCQFYSSCGSIVNQNGTLFRNPFYPSKYVPTSGADVCQVRIRKQANVCQLRLNFLKFTIDGPSRDGTTSAGTGATAVTDIGNCKTDMLTISAPGSSVPTLCGNLDNQHVYLDYGTSDTITLNVLLSQNAVIEREWNIEILMIPCRSEKRAPTGCLQWFQGVSGQVQSFNFPGGGAHLASTDYSVCVRQEEGMRSITWTACNVGDVKMTGPSPIPPAQPTTPVLCGTTATSGVAGDYFTIDGGVGFPLPTTPPTGYAQGTSFDDRFCDLSFGYSNNYVRTSVKPFIVHVRTDTTEVGATGGSGSATGTDASGGFCLKWQQSPS